MERGFEARAPGAAGEFEQAINFLPVLLVDAARSGVALDGDGGGFADDFTHHADGLHDAYGAEGLVGDADISAGHKHVFNVHGIEAAVGDRVTEITVDAAVVLGDGDEGIVGKFGGVFLLSEMEVNAPGAGHAAVGEILFCDDVFVREHDIADDAAGFARAADVGDPVELGVRVLGFAVAVFHRVEGAEDGAEVPIANEFEIVDGVFIETAFPKPLALALGGHVGLAHFGVREVVHLQVEGPGRFWIRARGGVVGPDPHVGHTEEVFEFDFVFSAGEVGEAAVAGAVDEEFPGELFLAARGGVERRDGHDFSADRGGGVDVLVEEE